MLRAHNNYRTIGDNIRLGGITGFAAGMVNVASFIILFSFTSNVTGSYAILASEIAKGNLYQIGIVLSWVFLFFFGGFISSFCVIRLNKRSSYWAHALPIILEIFLLIIIALYGEFFYGETLRESETLTCVLILAMGIQNGLTASITNFAVKTTHLTGITTDLGILAAMFTSKEYRSNQELRNKAKLLTTIIGAYFTGALCGGYLSIEISFRVFYAVSLCLLVAVSYDFYKIRISGLLRTAY